MPNLNPKRVSRLCTGSLQLLILLSLTVGSQAQLIAVTNSTSTPIPGSGHDYIRMFSETVDPANGTLNFVLQVPIPPGRGLSVPFSFVYNSNGVEFPIPSTTLGDSSWGTSKIDIGPKLTQGGWSYSVPLLTYVSLTQLIQPNTSCQTMTGFVFQNPTGGRHSLDVAHLIAS